MLTSTAHQSALHPRDNQRCDLNNFGVGSACPLWAAMPSEPGNILKPGANDKSYHNRIKTLGGDSEDLFTDLTTTNFAVLDTSHEILA